MNASHLTEGLRYLGAVPGAAPDDNPRVSGDQFDDPLWAGSDTCTAPHADIFIDHREVLYHDDRIKWTNPGTLSEPDTAVLTVTGAGKGQVRTGARPIADIVILLVHIPLDPGTEHSGHQVFHSPSLFGCYLGHALGHGSFTRKA